VSFESSQSLTGVWHGLYSYTTSKECRESHFTASLIDTGCIVSGTIHEDMNLPNGQSVVANAQVAGRHEGSDVNFMKSYDGTSGQTHTVYYLGQLLSGGDEIEGVWRILSIWGQETGRFLMIRKREQAEAVKMEAHIDA